MKYQKRLLVIAKITTLACANVLAAETDTNLLPTTAPSSHIMESPSLLIHPTRIAITDGQAKRDAIVSLYEERILVQSTPIFKYRLQATNGFAFSREVTSPRHLSGFAVVNAGQDHSFLFWLDTSELCFLELSSTNTKAPASFAPGQTSLAQADQYISLGEFEGSDQFWGRRADNCELGIISILVVNDKITITATNIFGKRFTFEKQSKKWRAYGESGELRRH